MGILVFSVHRLWDRQFVLKQLCKIVKPVHPMQSFWPYWRQKLQQGRLWHVTAGRQINRRRLKGKEEALSSQRIGSGDTSLFPWMKVTLGRSQLDYSQPWESRKDACVRPSFSCPASHVRSALFLIKSFGPRWVAGFALLAWRCAHSTCCPGRLTHTYLGIHLWIAPE